MKLINAKMSIITSKGAITIRSDTRFEMSAVVNNPLTVSTV